MEKIIELFNHKGGVSKTTTTFNLAWKLTQRGKKVLLVDGDPQCNLTGLFMGDDFDKYYEDKKKCTHNIKDAVGVAFNGRPQPIEAISCPRHIHNKKLFLIPGHMDLSEYERSLSLALNTNNAFTAIQNLPGSFYELIRKCSDKYSIDYVFIDMNPGLSSLNQTFFMYADGFIVPTNPDPFSVMALKTLSNTLPRWKKMSEQLIDELKDSSYPLPQKNMLFIGEIIQRFNIRNGKAATPYVEKLNEIRNYIQDSFIKIMEKENMLLDISAIRDGECVKDYCLGEIPDFGSLIQKANNAQKPVFDLSKDDMDAVGTVYENMDKKRDSIDVMFNDIATIVMECL